MHSSKQPFRPRGAENVVPSLHQRHKSTGNLLSMDSNVGVGFRGPAKRAAFGDVTNMARNVGNVREDAKGVKALTSAAPQQVERSTINKENMPYAKDALARPAQRLVGLSEKPKASAPQPVELVSKPTRPASQGGAGYIHNRDSVDIKLQIAGSSEQIAPLKHGRAFEAPPLQPRHHKSQPQLKPQQALIELQEFSLQKTTESSLRPSLSDPEAVAGFSQQLAESDNNLGLANRVRLVGLPSLVEDRADVNHEPESDAAHLEPLLPLEEDLALTAAIAKDGLTPTLSEPEEYWDDEDDEDDYDDQDQAYTTAHSFRSRDLTTGGLTTVLFPKVTSRVHRELEEARVDVEKNRSQEDICDELWDVSMVAEYGDDINDYMRELEVRPMQLAIPGPY